MRVRRAAWISVAQRTASTALGELGEDGVTSGIEDAAAMQLHQLFEHLLVGAKCLQRTLFVLCHQTAVRRDVGGKNRRQFSFEATGRCAAFGHSMPALSVPAVDNIEDAEFCHRGFIG